MTLEPDFAIKAILKWHFEWDEQQVFEGTAALISKEKFIHLHHVIWSASWDQNIRREDRPTRGGCGLLSLFYDDVETITLCAQCKLETSHPIKLVAGSAQKALTPGSSILNWISCKMDLFCGLFLNIAARLPFPRYVSHLVFWMLIVTSKADAVMTEQWR